MNRKRYTQEQVIVILKEYEAGLPAGELARRLGPRSVRRGMFRLGGSAVRRQ